MTQTTPFGDLTIAYDERVLAPRTWTTMQSAWADELLSDPPVGPVLELGCGAGQIGLLAVRAHPERHLVCVDASAQACTFTRLNAESAGLGDRVEARHGDLADALGPDERFALVIADPPWVPSAEIDRYPEDPTTAIDGGPDGLDVARACIRVAAPRLVFGGAILLQLGTRAQASALARETVGLALADLRTGAGGVIALFRPEVSPLAAGYC